MLQEAEMLSTTSAVLEGAPVLVQSVHPINLLSFGPETQEVSLGCLNVLIGANGSGKSNFIEALCLLRATPNDLEGVIRRGGGTSEWVYKNNPKGKTIVSVVMRRTYLDVPLRHIIAFEASGQRFVLEDEQIVDAITGEPFYLLEKIEPGLSIRIFPPSANSNTPLLDPSLSILEQRRDPERYPEVTYFAQQYPRIRAYREWSFGRNTVFRTPQRADMRTDRLEEDFSNLGLFLNKLRRNPQAKNAILTHLRDLYEGVDDYDVSIEGGTVQVFLTEGNITVPAARLSDGTLRYLCLLAILCDPTPPPLICIEEPELGLHPDILPKIADLLVEASTRTQLIVTTHSDILIDAMTERPECVLVCEKHDGQTQIKRLSRDDLGEWLQKYRLGELWTRGEIGGTRW